MSISRAERNLLLETFVDLEDITIPGTATKGGMDKIAEESARRIIKLRDRWSSWILLWINVLVFSYVGITVCIGIGLVNFHSHQWTLFGIVAQIAGMGYVVVKFLYPQSKKDKNKLKCRYAAVA